jgi:hypothetical protein
MLLAFCGLVSLAGCGQANRVSRQDLDKVRPGMTLAEVERLLGPGQEAGKDAPRPVEDTRKEPTASSTASSETSRRPCGSP